MKTNIKRTVASLLTAGMLLTGFTACKPANLVSALSKDADIDFEMVVCATLKNKDGQKMIYIRGYNKQENVDDESNIPERYITVMYDITEEDYDTFMELNQDSEIFYPFSNDTISLLKKIIKNNDPKNVEALILTASAYNKFDAIVEEHCKEN